MATVPNFIQSEDSGAVSLTTSYQEIVAGSSTGSFVMLYATAPGVAQTTVSIGNENVDVTEAANMFTKVIVPSNAGNSSADSNFTGPIFITQSGLIAGTRYDGLGNLGIILSDTTQKIKAKSTIAGVVLHYVKLNYGGSSARFYGTISKGRVAVTGSYADVVAGGSNGSVVDQIHLVNSGSTDRVVRFADENDRLLGTVLVPGNAGNTVARLAPQANFLPYLSRLEYDGYGNLSIRLKDSTKKIRVLQTAGTDVVLYYTINHF